MSFSRKPPGRRRLLLMVACLIAFSDFSLTGCSQGAGAGALSAEDKAKLRGAFKKKFQDSGERKTIRKSR
jgi:hypothetical protein